jgi:hypothetical protein
MLPFSQAADGSAKPLHFCLFTLEIVDGTKSNLVRSANFAHSTKEAKLTPSPDLTVPWAHTSVGPPRPCKARWSRSSVKIRTRPRSELFSLRNCL